MSLGSTTSFDATKMELTPCRVSFGALGTETDLGGTLGNVKVTWKYTKANIMCDQNGKSPIDKAVVGLAVEVEFELAEVKNKENWAIAFPHANVVAGTGTHATEKKIVFKSNLGDKDSSHLNSLILHPLSMADTDKSMDYNFPCAVGEASGEIVMSGDKQQALKVKMTVYPDATGIYCTVGDPALT